jgi:hypothetical protein
MLTGRSADPGAFGVKPQGGVSHTIEVGKKGGCLMGVWTRACFGLLVVAMLCCSAATGGRSADEKKDTKKKEAKDKPSYGKINAKLQARIDKGGVKVTNGVVSALGAQDDFLLFNVYNAGTNTEYRFSIPNQ